MYCSIHSVSNFFICDVAWSSLEYGVMSSVEYLVLYFEINFFYLLFFYLFRSYTLSFFSSFKCSLTI